MTAPWITYRPQIKVLDATIRDGGLINNSQFTDDFVKAVYETCVEAGIDVMEIGYKNAVEAFPKAKYGPWRYSTEEDITRIVGDNDTPLKIAVMVDMGGKSNWARDIIPKDQSPIDMVRVACYVNQISEACEALHHCHEMGYETMCNIMAISVEQENEIEAALAEVAKTPADTVVIVDSFGALYSEQVRLLYNQYAAALAGTGKEIGVHMHNNQQLAFANTIEGIICGANRIDATMGGMGRGAGNCCMELLLGFLRNPKYKIRPVWKLLQEHFTKLEGVEWGAFPQYMVTGQMNQHPRTAMAARDSADKDKYLDFYDTCVRDL